MVLLDVTRALDPRYRFLPTVRVIVPVPALTLAAVIVKSPAAVAEVRATAAEVVILPPVFRMRFLPEINVTVP